MFFKISFNLKYCKQDKAPAKPDIKYNSKAIMLRLGPGWSVNILEDFLSELFPVDISQCEQDKAAAEPDIKYHSKANMLRLGGQI